MGFFSWLTQDTLTSIANTHSSQPTSIVTMTDDRGVKFIEHDYEGYGVFGGKDYFVLLAEMNGKETRDEGWWLVYKSGRKDLKYPNLSHDPNWVWRNEEPKLCPWQGYWY